ncbi:hypothetical protein CTAYLR_003065 [Chrysophaeum taylorii]|uniref:Kinesin motor domain-containing protein n=1 Tax=Chrysophaeum taylorii TaxID=2483200 RepID=A0AAD7U6E1_9STRA|nr:hypothetical protein CTAYLR_003065 [Chrysophaeum taylorii]
MNSTKNYCPSDVARRRLEAIESARRKRESPTTYRDSSESPPPPPSPPPTPSPLPTRDFVPPPPSEEDESDKKIRDADEVFRAMLRETSAAPERPTWNDDVDFASRAPPRRRRRPRRQQPVREEPAYRREEPLEPPGVLEARRRAALEAEEARRRDEVRRDRAEERRKRLAAKKREEAILAARRRSRNEEGEEEEEDRRREEAEARRLAEAVARMRRQRDARPLKQRTNCVEDGAASKPRPLCVRREREQRRRDEEQSGEPETRRCLDKRTGRLRYARHFAAAVAEYRETAASESPSSSTRAAEPAARVVVRVRPLLPHETARGDFAAVSPDLAAGWVTVHECTMHADMVRLLHAARKFPCAAALGASVDEEAVFEAAARPALSAALGRRPAALFMFGQTGSGKTHSMSHVERRIAAAAFPREDAVAMRYFEIRGRKAFDLLSDEELRLVDEARSCRADGAAVAAPETPDDFVRVLEVGRARRATAATDVNGGSSRSHAVCRLEFAAGGSLTLVDCAGSERSQDSMYHDAQRRKESAEINQSIYALKECIRVHNSRKRGGAAARAAPVPFRSSALTRVLREALESDEAHLGVLATVSPAATDAEHSVSTLRTVCQLAGWPQKLLDSCSSTPVEVPKLPQPAPNAFSLRRKKAVLPKSWTAAQLAAFLERYDSRAATRVIETDLDATNLLRMSTAAVAAALTDGDANRATRLVYALRDEVARVDRDRADTRRRAPPNAKAAAAPRCRA